MKTFPLKISSPEGDVFAAEAVNLSVRGTEGELAVMAGHTPFVSAVRPAPCRITLEDGTVRTGNIGGGLLTVSKDKVLLLCGDFAWAEPEPEKR